jgi:O-glycosyl hydrolase
LSYYALIQCRRDQKKYYDRGFEEINLALAAHVSKLTAADYKAVRPTHSFYTTRYVSKVKLT